MLPTQRLFLEDAYADTMDTHILAVEQDRIALAETVFYARGGGQPGDNGMLLLPSGEEITIIDTVKSQTEPGLIWHQTEAMQPATLVGTKVTGRLEWQRRYRHMQMHTALHLLCAVIDAPVTGGAVGAESSRLDFDLPDQSPEKEVITEKLAALLDAGLEVSSSSITASELADNPALVRTVAVQPPADGGRIRMVKIGEVDFQPCGGTHVRNTSEIAPLIIDKIKKKGRANRRLNLVWAS